MFGKVKQAGQMLEAQKKFSELKKQLEQIEAEGIEGDVTVKVKGSIAMYELDSLLIDGQEVPGLKKALKKANKDMNKKLRKKFKSGDIDMGAMGMGM